MGDIFFNIFYSNFVFYFFFFRLQKNLFKKCIFFFFYFYYLFYYKFFIFIYGCGIIITEHSIQNLFQICDRATVIGEHTIIAEGKPKDILQSTKARELYFGSFDS